MQLTENNLPIFGVSTRNLRDFVTSERDQLRQITKIPTEEFRMWEIDLKQEEKKNKGGDKASSSD